MPRLTTVLTKIKFFFWKTFFFSGGSQYFYFAQICARQTLTLQISPMQKKINFGPPFITHNIDRNWQAKFCDVYYSFRLMRLSNLTSLGSGRIISGREGFIPKTTRIRNSTKDPFPLMRIRYENLDPDPSHKWVFKIYCFFNKRRIFTSVFFFLSRALICMLKLNEPFRDKEIFN